MTRDPFLERPGKLTGPVSYFEIDVSRKVGCVLTSNEVHFVSLAENFTVNFQKFWNSHLEWKTNSFTGPVITRSFEKRTTRLLLRAITHNTCYGWVCVISPWCYWWNCLLLVEFNHKVKHFLQCGGWGYTEVSQDLMTGPKAFAFSYPLLMFI